MPIRRLLSLFGLFRKPKGGSKEIPIIKSSPSRRCCLFSYPDASEAAKNMDFEIVEEYGDAFRNPLGKVVHWLLIRIRIMILNNPLASIIPTISC